MTLQEAIAQLRSMFEAYEYEERGRGVDMFEVGHFLEWAEKQTPPSAESVSTSDS